MSSTCLSRLRPRMAMGAFLSLGLACSSAAANEGGETGASGEQEGESGDATSETTGPVGPPGDFDLLTYNVAGLPQGLSSGDPEAHMHQISPLLNDFDIVVAQEDFWFHGELSGDAEHPNVSDPWTDTPTLEDMGDGLNRFSQYPFTLHERVAWWSCNGTLDNGSDCLATKGWSFARHTIDEGIEIDIYNLHMEAGGSEADENVRDKSVDDLVNAIAERSEGRAVIVAGDYNLHVDEALDLGVYTKLLDGAGLKDACWEVSCGNDSIDRVLFRGNASLELLPTSWEQPAQFVDEEGDGGPLSDHLPTAVNFSYTPQ